MLGTHTQYNGGRVNLFGLGAEGEVATTTDMATGERVWKLPAWATILSVAGSATGAYHGYKRNKSVGWALVWALLGGVVPIVTIPVSLAQGYAKRKS